MTYLDVSFRCSQLPSKAEMPALQAVREVYGILRISVDPKTSTVAVRYDASRLNEAAVESLLRQAGLDLGERIALV